MDKSASTIASVSPAASTPPAMTRVNPSRVYPLSVRLRQATAKTARSLHTYLSMASFAIILFFAVTGLTLNHPTWFANQQKTSARHGLLPANLLPRPGSDQADKLGIAEQLRARESLHGTVTDFRVDDQQVTVSFKGPGYTADAFIDRVTGKYDLTEVRSGFLAVVNDLHRGAETGSAWHLLIDISAIFLAAVSLTGITLMYFIYARRTAGFLLAALAAIVCLALYRLAMR